MGETVSTVETFDAILSRPPLRLEGPVAVFLGERIFRLPSGNDRAVAALLAEVRPRLDRAYDRLRDGTAEGPGELMAMAEAAGISPVEFSVLVSNGDFLQIYNDLRVIQTGEGPASETAQFLRTESRVGADSVVLDVGCSAGRYLWEHVGDSPRMLVGVDLNLFALTLGATAWESQGTVDVMHWVCADAMGLPFKDARFTNVQCFSTLNYLIVRSALAEFGRVLESGGRLVFTVEGEGYWRQNWDKAWSARRRVNLLRELAGNSLMRLGLDWQRNGIARRLSRNTHYDPATIARIADRSGFDVERCAVLREYKGQPWIIGVSARKRAAGSAACEV